jgi:hypothetical protein
MLNQPTNGSQNLPPRMPVKPIILPQSINIMKVDHQSHDDDKEKYNAVADKGLFKSTNWFLNSGANGHFYYNTDYFIQYERIDKNALTAHDNNKLLIVRKGIVKITVISPRNRYTTFYVTNVNHLLAVRLNILSPHALNNQSGIWGQWKNDVRLFLKDSTYFVTAHYSERLWKLATILLMKERLSVP